MRRIRTIKRQGPMAPNETREKVEEMTKAMASAVRLVVMYGEDHKLTKETVEGLFLVLDGILSVREEVTVGVIGNEIAFEKEPLYETSRQMPGFIEHLRKIEVEKITFFRGISKAELVDFCSVLAGRGRTDEEAMGIERALDSREVRHIVLGKVAPAKKKGEEAPGVSVRKNYQDGIDFLEEESGKIEKKQPLNVKMARHLVANLISDIIKNKNLLLILTSTRSHEESVFVHDVNVAIFTLLQAESLGIEHRFLTDIGIAALLHDVGKLSISGDILKKDGQLTEEEKTLVSLYPANGAKILLETPGISALPAIVAFEHQMLYDMSGYPKRLYGKKDNFVSMLITVASFYDTLRSKNLYREGVAAEKTYEEMMRLSGKYFHPDILNNFFSIIGVYPPGTLVEMDTGEIGIVIKESVIDMKRPQVEILYSADGEREQKSRLFNLLETDRKGKYMCSVARSIAPSDKYGIPGKYF
ncbi:MAG: hypothetical protein U9R44_07495 [Candidatus Omnitrophota bacterium]|nr:hypothetical protein [Candidatus Omnitrophota bacterium]